MYLFYPHLVLSKDISVASIHSNSLGSNWRCLNSLNCLFESWWETTGFSSLAFPRCSSPSPLMLWPSPPPLIAVPLGVPQRADTAPVLQTLLVHFRPVCRYLICVSCSYFVQSLLNVIIWEGEMSLAQDSPFHPHTLACWKSFSCQKDRISHWKKSFIPLIGDIRSLIVRLSHLLHNHDVIGEQLGKSDSNSNCSPLHCYDMLSVPASIQIRNVVSDVCVLPSGEKQITSSFSSVH